VLDTEASVGAIIRGALDANRLLRAQKLWHMVRIKEVELVELYEERAIKAHQAARNTAKRVRLELEPGERIEIEPLLDYTASGQFRTPPEDTAMGWWQRLFVTIADDEELPPVRADLDEDDDAGAPAGESAPKKPAEEPKKKKDRPMRFVVLGDRARVEAELQCRERNATRHLIKSAIATPAFNPELSGALFELLVPNPIKAASAAAPNVIMVLDHDTAQYPWEVLSDPMIPDSGPYAVRTGMLRQFIAPKYRPAPRYAGTKSALVIGDTLIEPNPQNLKELTGAQDEARGVSRVLDAAGYDTRLHIRATASEVQTALFARPYRILHLAGHGIYRPDRPAESGMVLGNNVYLTPCQLRQLRTVPDLVFLNCCFLGGVSPSANALAASVAEELINMGVKAIVAAGWAVDDSAAVTFASTFYQEMLERRSTFGDAVRSARDAVYRNHSATNTWAAYQCYGNPGFSLADAEERSAGGGPGEFCSKREYVEDIRTLSAKATALAGSSDPKNREYLAGQLTERVANLPAAWRDGEMLTYIGLAWRDIGDFQKAVEALENAFADSSATMPVKGVEQLVNMLARLAVQRHREAEALAKAGDTALAATRGSESQAAIDRAKTLMQLFAQLPPSRERSALLGSAAKKLATVTQDADRRQMLTDAAQRYEEAARLPMKPGDNPAYPVFNAVALRWLIDPATPGLANQLDEWRELVENWKDHSDHWKRAGWADYHFTKWLLDPSGGIDPIVQLYRDVAKQDTSESQWGSVIEHIEFVADMLENDPTRAARRQDAMDLADKLRNR